MTLKWFLFMNFNDTKVVSLSSLVRCGCNASETSRGIVRCVKPQVEWPRAKHKVGFRPCYCTCDHHDTIRTLISFYFEWAELPSQTKPSCQVKRGFWCYLSCKTPSYIYKHVLIASKQTALKNKLYTVKHIFLNYYLCFKEFALWIFEIVTNAIRVRKELSV